MRHTFIDLAERHSAAVCLAEDGEVLQSTLDAGPLSRPADVAEVVASLKALRAWIDSLSHEGFLSGTVAVEDVNPFAVNPKPAVRAQGVALDRLATYVRPEHISLTTASTWQRHHGYAKVKGKTSKGWAKDLCAELGFGPEGTAKEREDLRDAYLGALWLREVTG